MPLKHLRLMPALLLASALPAADWNLDKATTYLDSRQQAWENFQPAKKPHGTCISCHTGLGYMLLRQALHQPAPTPMETNLYASLRGRLADHQIKPSTAPGPGASVESVLAAVVLSKEKEQTAALDRMFTYQIRDGEQQGAFPWFSLKLDPWETAGSQYYGATLAALAISQAPKPYRERNETKLLLAYLNRVGAKQPLHHRLTLLSIRTNLIAKRTRREIIEQTLAAQRPDGGWTIAALGPWDKTPREEATRESDTYATAIAAYSLLQGGVSKTNPSLQRALGWLRAHQDPATGAWVSASMNKQFPADSMMVHFMTDAATAYATLALIK